MDTVVRSFIDDAETWAEEQWSNVTLGDARLERRAVELGAQMAKLPGASLSQQMGSWAQSKATYRLLDNAKASHEKLQRPHWAAVSPYTDRRTSIAREAAASNGGTEENVTEGQSFFIRYQTTMAPRYDHPLLFLFLLG